MILLSFLILRGGNLKKNFTLISKVNNAASNSFSVAVIANKKIK